MAVREALCDLLQVAGFSARTYAGPSAFLDDYMPGRFALLITDLRMPEMNGISLLRRLREMGAGLPAIIVTSALDPATQMQAMAEGAHACLPKPITDNILLDLVATALDRDGKRPPAN